MTEKQQQQQQYRESKKSNQKKNQFISAKVKLTILITILIFTAISIIFNILFHTELYYQGLNFIYDFQTNGSNGFITFLFNAISFFGDGVFVPIFLVVTFFINKRKVSAIAFVAYLTINLYIASVSKNAFQEARPFWENQPIQILQYFCSTQYGHPSGHSWISVLLFQPFITDFVGTKKFYLLLLIPITTGLLIPLSRLYLGMHSTDQIIMGLTFSFITLTAYRYFLQKEILKIEWRLMVKQVESNIYRYWTIAILIICNLVTLALPIIVFNLNVKHPIQQRYLENINQICNKNLNVLHMAASGMLQGSIGNVFFGLIFGFCLLNYKVEISKDFTSYDQVKFGKFLVGKWHCKTNFDILKIGLVYILIIALCAIPFFIPIIFVDNQYSDYILASIGMWSAGFGLSGITPHALFKLKLISFQEQNENSANQLKYKQSPTSSNKIDYPQTKRQMNKNQLK